MTAIASFSFPWNYSPLVSARAFIAKPDNLNFSNFVLPPQCFRRHFSASAANNKEAAAKAAGVTADGGAPTAFDKIINKEIPSSVVYEDDKVLAFRDINPEAPVHVLVIPKFRDGLIELGKAEAKHEEILGNFSMLPK